MRLLRNLKLRHRAYVCAYNSLRFAARLRSGESEFAPTVSDTIDNLGDELATLARDGCATERDRRHVIAGLQSALRAMELSDRAQILVVARIAPRIMAGEPASGGDTPWTRMAV
jgi:hypothetical protein